MYFVAYKIKTVAFFALIDVVADDDFDFAVKDVSEFFALVRHVFLKRRIRLDFDINRLHLVLLTVWHKPYDFLPVAFLLKKVVAREHDLLGFVFAEKVFRSLPSATIRSFRVEIVGMVRSFSSWLM